MDAEHAAHNLLIDTQASNQGNTVYPDYQNLEYKFLLVCNSRDIDLES